MSQPPPDAPPDVPVTPGRRLGRAAGRFARPFLWALAGLGLAVAAVPAVHRRRRAGTNETMRGLSRVTVDADDETAWGEAPAWHPRFVTVTVLGPELPPDPRWPAEASAEEIESAGGLSDLLTGTARRTPVRRFLPAAGLLIGAGATREGFYRQDADDAGRVLRRGPGADVPGRRGVGLGLVAGAGWIGLWGALANVRRGDRPRPAGTEALRRRLGRPWVWGLAGLRDVTLLGYGGWEFGRSAAAGTFRSAWRVEPRPRRRTPHPRVI